jgi:hypothetical protein
MKFAGPLLVPSVPIPKRALTALCPQLVADRFQAKGEIARRRGVMKQLITRQPPLGWVHESGPSSIKQQGVNGGHDAVIRFGRFRVLLRQRQLIADGAPIELGTRAPSTSCWSCWRLTDRWSLRTSCSAGCGRASWCRNTASRFRSSHCARRSAPTAMLSAPNSAAATGSRPRCA